MKLFLSLLILPIFTVLADPHSEYDDAAEQKSIRQAAYTNKRASQLAKKLEEVTKVTGVKEIECNLPESDRLIAYQMLIDTPEFNSILKGQKIRITEGRAMTDSTLWLTIDIKELEDKSNLKVNTSNLQYEINRIKQYQTQIAILKFKFGTNISCSSKFTLDECNSRLAVFKKEARLHPLIKNKTIVIDAKFENDDDIITVNGNASIERIIAYLKAQE